MKKIGIVGYGVVGKATTRLLPKDCSIVIRDPYLGFKSDVSDCDIVFIAINETDYSMSNLVELVDELVQLNTKGIFVLRTTVLPGITDRFIEKYSRTFVFMPEFLREWNAEYDSRFPDKIVIGTHNRDVFQLLKDLLVCKDVPIIRVKPVEAEIAKLALNSLALIKVVFAEELWDFSKALGADYDNVFRIFELDQNVNPRHLQANKDGYRGADGKCLPKDSQFLFEASRAVDSRISILGVAIELNKHLLRMRKYHDRV